MIRTLVWEFIVLFPILNPATGDQCVPGHTDYSSCSDDVSVAGAAGGRADFTRKALLYASNVEIGKVEQQSRGKRIPDISGKAKVLSFKVRYDISGIVIQSFTVGSTDVILQPPATLTWAASGAAASISASWSYKKSFIKDHGSLNVAVSGVSFKASLQLGSATSGHPTLQLSGCSASISNCDVKFHGGASWLYNLFSGNIEHFLKGEIENALCKSVGTGIIDLQGAINKLHMTQTFWKDQFIIDYGLASSPSAAPSLLSVNVKGESFWARNSQKHCSLHPKPLPGVSGNKMVYVSLSQYVFNCLSYVAHANQVLTANFTSHDLPDEEKDLFNTTCDEYSTCIGTYVPVLAKLYPNKTVAITASTAQPPVLDISMSNGTAVIVFNLDFFVRVDKNLHLLFTLRVDRKSGIVGKITDNTLTGKQIPATYVTSVVVSNVGKISAKLFSTVLQSIDNTLITPVIDKVLATGFKLPDTGGLRFINPDLHMFEGGVVVASDLELK